MAGPRNGFGVKRRQIVTVPLEPSDSPVAAAECSRNLGAPIEPGADAIAEHERNTRRIAQLSAKWGI